MWIAVLILMLNALSSSAGFINAARITVLPGLPVGIIDIAVAIGFVWAVFRGGTMQMQWPRLRSHPLFAWLMILWCATWLCGTLGSVGGLADDRDLWQAMRDFALVPLCIFIGYRLLATPRSVQVLVYWFIAAGLGNAIFLLFRFHSGAEQLQIESESINALRQIDYMTAYAAVTFVFMACSIVSGLRVMRNWLAALIGSICLLGAGSAISRSTLVVLALCFCSMYFLIPVRKLGRSFGRTMLLIPVVVASIWAGLQIATVVTQRDFYTVMNKQIESLMPELDENAVRKAKAWDTRLDSARVEFDLFKSSPLVGHGFTVISEYLVHGNTNYGAFGHNTWTLILARTGLVGASAFGVLVFSMVLIGRRMAMQKVDRSSVLMGALSYFVGVSTGMYALCTMIFNPRGILYFAIASGMLVRAREIQESTHAMQQANPEPLGDELSTDDIFAPMLEHGAL